MVRIAPDQIIWLLYFFSILSLSLLSLSLSPVLSLSLSLSLSLLSVLVICRPPFLSVSWKSESDLFYCLSFSFFEVEVMRMTTQYFHITTIIYDDPLSISSFIYLGSLNIRLWVSFQLLRRRNRRRARELRCADSLRRRVSERAHPEHSSQVSRWIVSLSLSASLSLWPRLNVKPKSSAQSYG